MEKDFISKMEQTLQAQRDELMQALMMTNDAFRALVEEGAEIGDAIDEASDAVDRKMLETIGSKDLNKLQSIDSALSRIRQGKYGICAKCGKPIPEARLEAIPHAVLCINCKSVDERRNR
ncbi:MAG: TraR/DksA family transcriptional regulator [Treponemataceae bacterium]|nr:MAG: TraR/DksA family transcriptional regulator [Treponemataceae bacterium]